MTKHSTAAPRDLSFLIKTNSFVSSLGGHSVVFFITNGIVAKIPFKTGDTRFDYEHQVFLKIETTPPLHIVRTFLCGPEIMFMQFIDNRVGDGTLKDRIEDGDRNRSVLLLMDQLSHAVAYLESFGLVHGDIKPANILVDDQDQLKLVDLDHAEPFGNDINVRDDPYVRGRKVGEPGGNYGVAGC